MANMQRGLVRGKKVRQQRFIEVVCEITAGDFSFGVAPTISGRDAHFIKSIERLSIGTFKITCKDTASRNVVFKHLRATNTMKLAYSFAVDKVSLTVKTQSILAVTAVASSRLIGGGLTFTADTAGAAGNLITVAFTAGATAGAEVVSVVGNAISVQIQGGVSTRAQIKTAIDASAPAQALVNTVVTTAGAQTVQTALALQGGKDAVLAGGLEDASFRVGFMWHEAPRIY